MGRNVFVTLLETTVLLDVVEVVPAYDDGALHLRGNNQSLQDLTTDGDVSGEGALLVDVVALNGVSGGVEAQTDFFEVSESVHFLGHLAGNDVISFDDNLLSGLLNTVQ